MVFVPINWVRKISTFANFHIFADITIAIGLSVIVFFAFTWVHQEHGFSPKTEVINTSTFVAFFGTAVYSFEGIGIIIPIMDSSKYPQKYSKIVMIMLIGLTSLYIVFAMICYFSFGDKLLNSAPLITKLIELKFGENYIVEATMFLWILNLIITYPLCLYPAHQIIESYLYGDMPRTRKRYWMENCSRTVLVAMTVGLGLGLRGTLDRLMSIIGSMCCAPIAFIFPAGFHLALVAKTRAEKVIDVIIICIGAVLMVFGTVFTIATWNSPG